MANQDDEVSLPDLANAEAVPATAEAADETSDDEELARTAHDLEAVFDVPVNVSAVLGKTHIEVSNLLKLGRGAVVELDRVHLAVLVRVHVSRSDDDFELGL